MLLLLMNTWKIPLLTNLHSPPCHTDIYVNMTQCILGVDIVVYTLTDLLSP